MPRLSSVAEAPTFIPTGAAADPAAPVVFWDGYGLGCTETGIFQHARRLASELTALNVFPTVVGNIAASEAFQDLPSYVLKDPVLLDRLGLRKLSQMKPVWPYRVGRLLEEGLSGYRKPYIIHGLSNFNVPLRRRAQRVRKVLTLHDLIPLLAPRDVGWSYQIQFRHLVARAVEAADRIVCISQWTKKCLIEAFPSARAKAVAIPNGITREMPRAIERAAADVRIQALYVARYEPYKQHGLLLTLLRAKKLPLKITMLTSPRGVAALRTMAPDLLATGELRLITGISDAERDQLYRSADVYLSPSRLEGYCLPAAEAMAAGLPVIYVPGSGIDEVCGTEAAFIVSAAEDMDAWVAAIADACAARSTPIFEEKIKRHLAKLPSWKEAAVLLKSLYNELV